MTRYVVRRILGFIPLLLVFSLFVFVLVRAIPGGPFDFVGDRALPASVVANINAKYHLDWPTHMQYLSFLLGDDILGAIFGGVYAEGEGISRGLIRGDLGVSLHYRGQTVMDTIKTTFPVSFQLGVLALAISLVIGLPAGIIAALRQNTWIDYSATFIAVVGVSVPTIVLGPLLIWIFSVSLGWLPAATWGVKPPYILGLFPSSLGPDFWKHAILPAMALGSSSSASIARLTRASLLQVVGEDYIRTARAKGLKERVVIIIHALKNSLIPVVTLFGPLFAAIVTGTFVAEQIFGIPGMGKHFVTSIGNRDYPLILGVTLLYTILLISMNLIVDITYAWLDPRIRYD